jgi:type II secretory pathway pseudopilin PulG
MTTTRRKAITLSETLITAAVILLLILVAALGIDSIRTELKLQQTWSLLALLDQSLDAYRQTTGHWPAAQSSPSIFRQSRSNTEGSPAPATTQNLETAQSINTNAQHQYDKTSDDRAVLTGWRILAVLSAVQKSRQLLRQVPPILREKEDENHVPLIIQDAWGTPLRCLTLDSRSRTHRQAVAAHGNKPIFVSAGTDRQFGQPDVVGEADNLRSDELPRTPVPTTATAPR